MIQFQKQKLFTYIFSKAILRLLKIMAPVLNIDFINAVLEAINYLVIFKY